MIRSINLYQNLKRLTKSPQAKYFFLWILSLFIFYLILFVVDFDFSTTTNSFYLLAFLGDIAVGGIAFLLLCTSIVLKLFTKSGFLSSMAKIAMVGVITFGFFYLLISMPNTSIYKASQEKSKANQPSTITNTLPGNTAVKPNQAQATPLPSTKVTNTKAIVTPKPSPYDGKIDCGIDTKCGGGTIRLTKDECAMSTCCEVGSTWSFYRDKSKCSTDQTAYYTNLYKTTTYTTPTPSYPPCEVYYPVLGYSQTYNYMSTDACNTAKRNAVSYTATTISTPTPTPQVDYTYENSRCKGEVRDWYTSEKQRVGNQLRALGAGDSSAYEQAMKAIESKAEKMVEDCDYYYPVN